VPGGKGAEVDVDLSVKQWLKVALNVGVFASVHEYECVACRVTKVLDTEGEADTEAVWVLEAECETERDAMLLAVEATEELLRAVWDAVARSEIMVAVYMGDMVTDRVELTVKDRDEVRDKLGLVVGVDEWDTVQERLGLRDVLIDCVPLGDLEVVGETDPDLEVVGVSVVDLEIVGVTDTVNVAVILADRDLEGVGVNDPDLDTLPDLDGETDLDGDGEGLIDRVTLTDRVALIERVPLGDLDNVGYDDPDLVTLGDLDGELEDEGEPEDDTWGVVSGIPRSNKRRIRRTQGSMLPN
jgi:hypothetical protein